MIMSQSPAHTIFKACYKAPSFIHNLRKVTYLAVTKKKIVFFFFMVEYSHNPSTQEVWAEAQELKVTHQLWRPARDTWVLTSREKIA